MVKRNKKQTSEKEISKTQLIIDTVTKNSEQESNKIENQWKEEIKYVRKTFPGPSNILVPLRIAIDREAFVNMTAHVTNSIDKEVCGVLIGEVCLDDEGSFVHVRNIIQGSAAHQGGAHVTFTHETWNQIHEQLENEFPSFDILGWYHSHPGFGVMFSDMDLFIQRNFFSSPTQFALVMDPLGGEKAICVNTAAGIKYIDKFWVDGREFRAFKEQSNNSTEGVTSLDFNIKEALNILETRLNQVLNALDKLSMNIFRAITVMGTLFLLVIAGLVIYSIFFNPIMNDRPPKMLQYVPIPLKIQDKNALIGVGVVGWDIPEDLSSKYIQKKEKKKNDLKDGKGDNNYDNPESKK